MLLLPRIVQCCENEVLGIVHRTFYDQGWTVRALVFDGLVAELSDELNLGISGVMAAAEAACKVRGWDIRLTEKELLGKQDEPLPVAVDARMVYQRVCAELGGC